MPPGASRCCPCTTPSPTTAASSPSPTTDNWRTRAVGTGCSCRDPSCGQVGKHPLGSLVPHGVKDATTNRARVLAWWTRQPQANIGLATGHRFDVLDVDGPTGAQAIRAFAATHGLDSSGPLVRTGGGGWHYYLAPTGLGNVRPRDLEQVDWRGRGGYVVAPPSRHASGHPYQWVAGRDLDTPLAEVPAALAGAAAASPGRPTRPGRLRSRWATGQDPLCAGGPRPGAGPGRHRPQGPAQPPAVGSRPATSTTWSPPAPSTTARSTRGSSQAAERCGLLAEEPRQTHRTLASGRQVGLAHPRPAPDRTQPRTHPCFATPASPSGRRTNPGGEVRAMAAAGHPAG